MGNTRVQGAGCTYGKGGAVHAKWAEHILGEVILVRCAGNLTEDAAEEREAGIAACTHTL